MGKFETTHDPIPKTMACPICCEDFATSIAACRYCQFEACPKCTKRYLMDLAANAPKCMSCKKEWSFEFIMENIPDKAWVAAYLAEHIFHNEHRLLPASQRDAHILRQIRDLRDQVQHMPTVTAMQKRRLQNDLIDQKRHEKRDIAARIKALKAHCTLFDTTSSKKSKESAASQTTYIMKCPADSCRGYINKSFVCETCCTTLCDKCHIPLCGSGSTRHKCDPDAVLTASEIMQTTRQCPKCFVPIWKMSGCNQIFCTACHCMFDWETRKIDNGVVHNPHYFEWLAANPPQQQENIENIACGQVPPLHIFAGFITHHRLYAVYQSLNHFEAEVRRHHPMESVKDNHDLRVSYLLNDFDQETFKSKLYNREKRRMKLRAINDLITLEIKILADLVRTIVFTKQWSYQDIMKTYHALAEFHEEALANITRVHGGRVHPSLNTCFAMNIQ